MNTENKRPVSFRMNRELLDRLNAWIKKQPVKIDKTAVMEAAISKFLDEQK